MILLTLSCHHHQTWSHTLVAVYEYEVHLFNKMYTYFPLLRFSWMVPGYHWQSFQRANTRSSAHCNNPSCGVNWPILKLLLPSCVIAAWGLLSSGLFIVPCEFVGVSKVLSLLLLLVVTCLLLDDDLWGTCFSEGTELASTYNIHIHTSTHTVNNITTMLHTTVLTNWWSPLVYY